MQAIVLDLEWNQPMTFRGGGYRQSGGQLLFEMIQIGAVKLNENREILDTFNQLIQPTCYRRLNPHIEKITHITQEQLDESPLFQEAYKAFIDWCGEDCVLLTWGCDDISVFEQNVRYFDCEDPLPPICDIQKLFSDELGTPNERKSLKRALEALSIEPNDDKEFHNALNDAYYTALVYAHMQTPEKVMQYRLKPKQLIHQDRKRRQTLSVHRINRGVPTILKSKFGTQVPCPVCNHLTPLAADYCRYTPQRYTALAVCENHGLFYVKMNVITQEDKKRYLERVTVLTEEQSPAYVHTKLLQWQQKLASQEKGEPS
ncbi:MAG: exonuclease domain-containing protein [Clostridia bacterium]|nr:exonuclease domain-containing protein [Clostridia bacterium]